MIWSPPERCWLAGLPMEASRLELMARLLAFYFQSRYPGKTELPEGPAAEKHAQALLNQAEETVEWLLSTLI